KGVVVHGGHLGVDEDAATGFDNWRKCIDGLDMPVPVLIENTAGGDNAMARRLEAIDRLWEAIGRAEGGDTVGFCLHTCPAGAGGGRGAGAPVAVETRGGAEEQGADISWLRERVSR